MASSRPSKPKAKAKSKGLSPARPSASVVLLSPANEVLLLHRVQTSTSFASAYVFPGGNVDAFHDGDVPAEGEAGRHEDGPAYRMAAVRECFEEAGLLLARRKDRPGDMLVLGAEEREAARRRVHGSDVRFAAWLDSVGGLPDVDALVPVTRWITPTTGPKRFTTQMYLYLLPLASDDNDDVASSSSSSSEAAAASALASESLVPTPDGGIEHTAATFASPASFLARAAAGDIIIFPPQVFLLNMLTRFIPESPSASSHADLADQRRQLLDFVHRVPAADTPRGRAHPTAAIPWADKAISPHILFIRASDGRSVLGLDHPGPELKNSDRAGDWERVVLVRFVKAGPREVEIRLRDDVLEEERQQTNDDSKL
jgi:8-oxo-dGTP pyrophosphatase MutT (NUDIX family)